MEITSGIVRWTGFNKEAQAFFIEDLYEGGEAVSVGVPTVVTATGPGTFFLVNEVATTGRFLHSGTGTPVDRTALADDGVEALLRINFRLSQWF
jgi:hypothetical protein